MSKKNKIIALIIVVLIALSGSFIAYKQGHSQNNSNGVVIDKNAQKWNKELQDASNDKGIKIPGYGDLSVGAGEKNWRITLLNPEGNDCYFKYTITVNNSSKPLYTSNYIEPGKAIKEFKVKKSLKAGNYTLYMNIATYTMDGKNTRLNGASVKADLRVI